MGKSFTNLADLFRYIEDNVPLNLNKIGEEIKSVLRQNIRVLWYNRPFTPTHYTRTEELINCLELKKAIKIGSTWQVEIFFNTDKINPYPAENGEWSKHESITNGEDVTEMIPYWTNYGQDSPLFSYDGVGFLEETVDWVKETGYLKMRMIELLSRKGFKCV